MACLPLLVRAQNAEPPATEADDPIVVYTRSRPVLAGQPELSGVIASSDPRLSRAIFVDGSGKHVVYGIGDAVMPGVFVDAIERDYVVLNRGGRAEAMQLRRGTAPPADVALVVSDPAKYRGGGGAAPVISGYDPVAERMGRLRANVSATPPPLPPVSTAPLDIQRGKDSPKLPRR
jgi:type II secretory pathway component PulC